MLGKGLALVGGLLVGLLVASNYFAYVEAHRDAALGLPLWVSQQKLLVLYSPWSILRWFWLWGFAVPQRFALSGMAGVLVAAVLTVKLWPPASSPPKARAHWATRPELQHAELLGDEGSGPVLGKLGRTLLRYHGDGHLLVKAGTGGGKTAAIVKPTLLEYRGSMLIHDPKGGLWQWRLPDKQTWHNSAGYRAALGKVIKLAPLDDATDGFNLWDMVRIGTDDAYRDAQLISLYLSNPEGRMAQDDTSQHFKDLVNIFMPGVFLYGLESGIATHGAAFNELVNGSEWHDVLTVMQASANPVVRMAAMIAGRPGDRELGSLQTSLARCLSLWNDPRIARMTRTSTFTLTDLREQAQPCTVYLSIPFNEQERLRVFTVLTLRLLLDYCTSKLTGWRHDLLAVLEEFPSLKRCDFVSQGLDQAREFGVRYLLVTPSMRKLEEVYGKSHNFYDGCRVQVSFGLTDVGVAKGVSQSLGTQEHTYRRVTRQKGGKTSTTEEVREEPLLSTTGLLDMDDQTVLVQAGRYKRLVAQTRYYQARRWVARAQLPLPPP